MQATAMEVVRKAAAAFRPPRAISVSDGIRQSLVLRQPGGANGPWSSDTTPYMVEPIDALGSRTHDAVVFVGPSRTGKTMGLIDGWAARNIACDPGDMLIVQMTQEKAREFSKLRVDRMIRHSPKVAEHMRSNSHNDNTYDKLFTHGMWLKLGWPSASQLSSTDYRYVALTDYDRFPENIDGEGTAFFLALKRIQTFLSRGMCVVESSPGRDVEDPGWEPDTPHEAPPVTGVLSIYNSSDRRRWYWRCFDCRTYFEAKPGLSLFATLPSEEELIEEIRRIDIATFAKDHAKIACPHCGSQIEHRHKTELNDLSTARWVPDNQTIDSDGNLLGEPANSNIAGFWMGGVAAAYQSWESLLQKYLQGIRELALTGTDLTLKTSVNTDQGMPYTPQHLRADTSGKIEDRLEDCERYIVPDEARFAIATVDVQAGSDSRFVVEVRAFGPGLESWLIDRYAIRTTKRGGDDAQVDPAAYLEDWDLLTEKVVQATYRTNGDKELRVYRVGVDTGGEKGTAPNAYAWYRKLRKKKLSSRVLLLKGSSVKQPEKPMVKGHARDNQNKKMLDLPVWQIHTDYYKDVVAASVKRVAPGPNFFHPPKWVPGSYYDELRAEVRQANGKWKQIRPRNEALDLWVYALAICEALNFGTKGKLDWEKPPSWALPLGSGGNSELITSEERRAEQKQRRRPRSRVGKSDWSGRL